MDEKTIATVRDNAFSALAITKNGRRKSKARQLFWKHGSEAGGSQDWESLLLEEKEPCPLCQEFS